MKITILSILLTLLVCVTANCQNSKPPLLANLSKIKSTSENKLKDILKGQELSIATLEDKDQKREQARLKNYADNKACIDAYNEVQTAVDQLITQLKADLTISNKKKLLKQLNKGVATKDTWYSDITKEIHDKHAALAGCNRVNAFAIGVEDVTGIFTAITDVVASARDFRQKQIEALCGQLDELRLKPLYELMSGSSSEDDKK